MLMKSEELDRLLESFSDEEIKKLRIINALKMHWLTAECEYIRSNPSDVTYRDSGAKADYLFAQYRASLYDLALYYQNTFKDLQN